MKHISDSLLDPNAKEGSLRWLAAHPEELEQRMAALGMFKRDPTKPPADVCQYGCGAAGFMRYDVPFGHPLFGKSQACQCTKDKAMQTQEQRIEEYKHQMTATEQTYTLDNWIGSDEKARAAAKHAVNYPYGLILFIGNYGIGKSGLLTAICNHARRKKLEASYLVLNVMLNKLKASFAAGIGTYETELEKICTVRVLALDEMSAYKPSEWADQTLRTIFDERYRHYKERLTVIGSNDMPQHEAIVSRLNDSVRSQIVYMQGSDLRSVAKELSEQMQIQTDEEWLMDEADVRAQEFDDKYTVVGGGAWAAT